MSNDKNNTQLEAQFHYLIDYAKMKEKKIGRPLKQNEILVVKFFKSILEEVPAEQRIVVYTFFSIYTFFTVTSLNHIIVYFKISNNIFYSILLAVSYEFGSFSLILALINVKRIGKVTVYSILIFLNLVIAIGNSYSSYINITDEVLQKFCEFAGVSPTLGWKRVIAWIQGSTTPIFALSFAKATLNYLKPNF